MIRTILFDTTVIIDLWRGRTGIKILLEKFKEEVLCISAITIGEIYDGLGYTKEKRGVEMYTKIKIQFEKIINEFEIIPINLEILKQSGKFKGCLRANGTTLDFGDCIIGISAEIIKAGKLVSRNPKHFNEFKIPIKTYSLN